MSGSLAAARANNDPRGARDLRPLSTREKILDEMLDHFTEARETLFSGRGRDNANDAGLLLMPVVWNESYRELERVLQRMQDLAAAYSETSPIFRHCYWHLSEWYLRSSRYPQLPRKRKVQRGREVVEVQDAPRYRIIRHGEPRLVLKGLVWVSAEFVGEPFIPVEILEPAA